MARRRSTIAQSQSEVITIWRPALARQKLVYFLIADRSQKYPEGRSRIVYIGTTKKGASRIAASAAFRGEQAFGSLHGVTKIQAYVIGCRPRKAMQIWKKLESAAIITFRREYGAVPNLNRQGRKKKKTDEFDYFNEDRLVEIFKRFE